MVVRIVRIISGFMQIVAHIKAAAENSSQDEITLIVIIRLIKDVHEGVRWENMRHRHSDGLRYQFIGKGRGWPIME